MNLLESLRNTIEGEVIEDPKVLLEASKDASIFKVKPRLVVYPKNSGDLEKLVTFVKERKLLEPSLSLTARAAGTDMSGGPLNESIIADFTEHMNTVGAVEESGTRVSPGLFYRDFEKETLRKGLILPCYTASKNLCALGGMIANNCGGEKTLRYGKMENFVVSSKYVFSDGKEYEVKPLSKIELETKIRQDDFEGHVYKELYELIEENREAIEKARPEVSKNSAGYAIWNVWNGESFDLNRLLTGAQGTLGIMSEARVRLVPAEKASQLFVIFLHDLERLPEIINVILPTHPDSIESYDDATLKMASRFFPEVIKTMKPKHFFSLIRSFIPEIKLIIKGGVPKLILLVEYSGETEAEAEAKIAGLQGKLDPYHLTSRKTISDEEEEKYWTVRRESFNLLRKHVHGFRTAPFIDDVVVKPEDMPAFLPKLRAILDEYNLTYTVAGHAGNGNFHIIPLMDMKSKKSIDIIKEASERVYSLVGELGGSITGEHNDGIIRTPYLHKMYPEEILDLFKRIKQIFDPLNIFNPGKKVSGTIEYLEKHVDHS